jgi:hypothetical protein
MPADVEELQKALPSPEAKPDDEKGEADLEENFPPEVIDGLRKMTTAVGTRQLVLRRNQVKEAWKQRLMYRGFQRLVDGGSKGWSIGGEGGLVADGLGDDSDTEFRNNENIFFAYGQIITAALTGARPTCRFTANNLAQADDLNAAENAEAARQFVERNNPINDINSEGVRYLYTDGVYYYATSWNEETEQEDIEVFGALEVERSMTAKNLKDSPFLQLSQEKDKTIWKEKFPEVAKKITGGNSGTSQNQFDRIARISANSGMGSTMVTGDSFAHLVTGQVTWLRPSFYHEAGPQETQDKLRQLFPRGVKVTFVGNTFCEAVEESMDERVKEVFAFPGDGANRPSIGNPLVEVQLRLNDLLDILYETFDHGIPWRWVSSEIDLNAIADQQNSPGMTGQVKVSTGRPLSDYFFVETQLDVPASMITQIKSLENEVAQLMVGAFPALFGGTDLGANAAVGTTTIQRDQALGRLGQIYRYIKSGYAGCIEQAVLLAAEYRSGNISTELPGNAMTGSISLEVDFDALNKGGFKAHTDSDENFPEQWATKKNTFMAILMAAEKNPGGFAADMLKDPSNKSYAKYVIGLPDILLPEEVSRNKQLTEIGLLLKGSPLPNPELQQLVQTIQQTQAQGQPIDQFEQQAKALPKQVSSVPIDKPYDNHNVEFQEVTDWVNSKEGQKQKLKNPSGFQNVEMHGMEHQAYIKQLASENAAPPVPKESINLTIPLDKMPAEVQSLIFTKLGFTVGADVFDAADQKDVQNKLIEKSVTHPVGAEKVAEAESQSTKAAA